MREVGVCVWRVSAPRAAALHATAHTTHFAQEEEHHCFDGSDLCPKHACLEPY